MVFFVAIHRYQHLRKQIEDRFDGVFSKFHPLPPGLLLREQGVAILITLGSRSNKQNHVLYRWKSSYSVGLQVLLNPA